MYEMFQKSSTDLIHFFHKIQNVNSVMYLWGGGRSCFHTLWGGGPQPQTLKTPDLFRSQNMDNQGPGRKILELPFTTAQKWP